MPALELSALDRFEIEAELDAGRRTIVVEARTGGPTPDEFGHVVRMVADRLDAFMASVADEGKLTELADVLPSAGFERLVVVPAENASLARLAEAIDDLEDPEGMSVTALIPGAGQAAAFDPQHPDWLDAAERVRERIELSA